MQKHLQYILRTVCIICLSIPANAQPNLNIPVNDSPGIVQSINYPGLADMSGPTKFNVLTTIIPDQPLQSLPATLYKYRQRKDYVDGLGRPLQSVELRAHVDGFDLVKAHVYDSLGRERFQYQPVAVPAPLAVFAGNIKMDIHNQMWQFYDQAGADEQPYGRTDFEESSLGRPLKQYAPGRNWVGMNRGQEFKYQNNVAGEVMKWTISRELSAVPTVDGSYGAAELTVSVVIDEDGNKTKEFKDKNGNLILKKNFEFTVSPDASHTGYACTYYVYDDQNRLRYVIPPAAVYNMPAGWDVNGIKEYCFSYDYDHRGRLIQKKIPGKEPEEYVYDKRDRLVYSRDGKQKAEGKWAFILYDGLDRPIVTGIGAYTSPRDVLQGLVDAGSNYPAPSIWAYVNNFELYDTYPNSIEAGEILSYTYYDNYEQLNSFGYDGNQFSGETAALAELEPPVLSTVTHGLVTGSKVRVLDPEDPGANKWITTVNYYDNKGRLLQTQSQNIYDGLDISSNLYYFQGMLWKSIQRHQNPNAQQIPGAIDSALTTFKVVKTSTRNIRDRGGNDQVSKLVQQINGGPVYNISEYHYDHLNRPVVKDYGGSLVLQEYNMRGFLHHIGAKRYNDGQSLNVFDERIRYDWGFKGRCYNGNIAGLIWAYSDDQPQAYGYSYDKLDRLTHAEYRYFKASNWSKTIKDYSVSGITYDPNGNLLTMKQRSGTYTVSGAVQNMDLLTYSYQTNTNRLIKVEDAAHALAGLPDFRNGANLATEYNYDPNGNMTRDENKKVSITYNHLNKPDVISVDNKGNIDYVYDASGNLLQKRIDSSGTTTVYDYFGNFVYKDNVLQYILNDEGRARPVANDSTQGYTRFVYDHFIKDHLGNVRSTVTATPITVGYLARHEIATANVEQLVFDNIPNVRDAKPGSINPNDGMAAHLDANGADTRIGTAIMLKVMPGDKFTISATTYHQGQYSGGEETGSNALVESLMNALMGGSTYAGVPVSDLPENIRIVKDILENPALPGQLAILQSDDVSTAPKAHLNYLFFNEQMELQPDLSGSIQVSPTSNLGWEILNPGNICNCTMSPTGPNGGVTGYILVYVDNQSLGKSVWFDDVHIEHYTSSVLEENHYYPFGLTVGVGQSAQTNLPNQPYKYQGIVLERNLGLETYETFYRGLDPQIGRFRTIDPKPTDWISPYASMNNNPVLYSDPFGDSVNVAGIYEKNDKGEFVNPGAVSGFEYFASTKLGKQYILDHAEQGFSLEGSVVKDLNIVASKEGAASANGVDITFGLGSDVGEAAGAYTSSYANGGRKSEGGRLKTRFILPREMKPNRFFGSTATEETIYNTQRVAHEALLHGLLHENRYYRDYIRFNGQDHSDKIFNSSFYGQKSLSLLIEAQQLYLKGNKNALLMSTKNMQLMIDLGRGAHNHGASYEEISNYKAQNK